MTSNPAPRQPAGIPTGGQFAAGQKAENTSALTVEDDQLQDRALTYIDRNVAEYERTRHEGPTLVAVAPLLRAADMTARQSASALPPGRAQVVAAAIVDVEASKEQDPVSGETRYAAGRVNMLHAHVVDAAGTAPTREEVAATAGLRSTAEQMVTDAVLDRDLGLGGSDEDVASARTLTMSLQQSLERSHRQRLDATRERAAAGRATIFDAFTAQDHADSARYNSRLATKASDDAGDVWTTTPEDHPRYAERRAEAMRAIGRMNAAQTKLGEAAELLDQVNTIWAANGPHR